MKALGCSIVALFSYFNAMSQTKILDSLHRALVSEHNVSSRTKIMFTIGSYYMFQNIDSATHYMRLTLANNPDDKLKASVLQNLCANYRFVRPDSTFYYGNLALKLARENDFNDIQPDIFVSLSLTEFAIGNMPQAMQFALQVVKLAEESKQPYYQAFGRALIGDIYRKGGSYFKSISTCKQALSGFYSMKALYESSATLATIGRCFAQLNQPDSAIYYSQRAVDLVPETGYFINDILGSTFHRIGNHEKSLAYFQKSIQSPELYIDFNGNLEIAEIYLEKNNLDSTLLYGKRAHEIAMRSGFYSNIITANTFMSHFYESRNPAQGIKYADMALVYKDSLMEMERSMVIEGYLDVDAQQRQREIDEAKREFQSQIKTNAFLGSSFTLLVIAIMLYLNNRQKQKSKRKVEAAYERLKSTQSQLIQSEKMASLGELTAGIAHEIQNPLNFVNNFSEVNAELIRNLKSEIKNGNIDEVNSIANDIESNEEKIVHHGKRADGIVKSMLQHSRTSAGQKELTDINALCDEYLRLSFHGYRAKDKSFNAKFEVDFDSTLPKIKVVPQDLGRVVLNLINNAFYAVNEKMKTENGKYDPLIIVSTHYTLSSGEGKGEVKISIKDNGPGIPDSIKEKIFQPFFTTKPTGQGTGLGLSLAYDIVKAHGGKMAVEATEGEGSEFIIQLPIADGSQS